MLAERLGGRSRAACHPLLPLPAVGDNAAMQTEPPTAEPPKLKRCWFQFSLRTLLIGVTLLAIPCAYVGWQVKIVKERKVMVREVTEMGGHVTLASEITKFGPDVSYQIGETKVKTPYPAVSRLRAWLGDDSALGIGLP
jgi:hypothetical protein